MFEIGFSEILVIAAIALVVLGPEKLPKIAAQVGHWTGRARAMARQLRTQLEQEANLQEAMRAAQQQPKPHAPTPDPVHESPSEHSAETAHAEPAPSAHAASEPHPSPEQSHSSS